MCSQHCPEAASQSRRHCGPCLRGVLDDSPVTPGFDSRGMSQRRQEEWIGMAEGTGGMDRDGRVVNDKLELLGNHRCSDGSYWPLRSGLGQKEGARISEDLGHQICISIHRECGLLQRGEIILVHSYLSQLWGTLRRWVRD